MRRISDWKNLKDNTIASIWSKFCIAPVYLLSSIFPALKRVMADGGLPIFIISAVSGALLVLVANILIDKAFGWKLGIVFYIVEFCGILIWNSFWLCLHGDILSKNRNRS